MNTKYILNEIKDYSPCKEGFQSAYQTPTIENLCQLFFANSDWALRKNFPSKSVLQKYSGYYERYGVFYSTDTLLKGLRMAIFNCESELQFTGYEVSEIFIRGNSKIKIKASGSSKLFITILDNSELNVEVEDSATVDVFQYGGRVSGNGEVKQCRWD